MKTSLLFALVTIFTSSVALSAVHSATSKRGFSQAPAVMTSMCEASTIKEQLELIRSSSSCEEASNTAWQCFQFVPFDGDFEAQKPEKRKKVYSNFFMTAAKVCKVPAKGFAGVLAHCKINDETDLDRKEYYRCGVAALD